MGDKDVKPASATDVKPASATDAKKKRSKPDLLSLSKHAWRFGDISHKVVNYHSFLLDSGIYKFQTKDGNRLYYDSQWQLKKEYQPKKVKAVKPKFIIKPIGGAKNGGVRKVNLKKRPKSYLSNKDMKVKVKRKYEGTRVPKPPRPALQPGAVCILLADRWRGKRCVLLKKLSKNKIMVAGPHGVNKVPVHVLDPAYVIATSTKINVSGIEVPESLHKNFKQPFIKKKPIDGTEIFATKKEKVKKPADRVKEERAVNDALMKAIRARKDYKMMKHYLSLRFTLKPNQFPHRMKF